MEKACAKCKKDVEHVHRCVSCGKEFCLAHSRHHHGKYYCEDCLKKVYRAPQRRAPEVRRDKGIIEKKIGLEPIAFTIAILIAVAGYVLFFEGIDIGMPQPTPPAPEENQTLTIREDMSIPNSFGVMMPYIEITDYSLQCDGDKVTQIRLKVKAGPKDLEVEEVKLNRQKVDKDDWSSTSKIHEDKTGYVTINKIDKYTGLSKANEQRTTISVIANDGLYQQADFIPNANKKC